MKKTIIAVLAAATLITGAATVSASGMHHMGMRNRTGVCSIEDCPNNGNPAYSCMENCPNEDCPNNGDYARRNAGGHHRGCGERNPEYCPYR